MRKIPVKSNQATKNTTTQNHNENNKFQTSEAIEKSKTPYLSSFFSFVSQ